MLKKLFFFHRRGVGGGGVKFGWKIPLLLMFFYWNLPLVSGSRPSKMPPHWIAANSIASPCVLHISVKHCATAKPRHHVTKFCFALVILSRGTKKWAVKGWNKNKICCCLPFWRILAFFTHLEWKEVPYHTHWYTLPALLTLIKLFLISPTFISHITSLKCTKETRNLNYLQKLVFTLGWG